jgi:hypothetical protein
MQQVLCRARWHLFRFPIARVFKMMRRLMIMQEVRRRKVLLEDLPYFNSIGACAEDLVREGHCKLNYLVCPDILPNLAETGSINLNRAHTVEIKQKKQKIFGSDFLTKIWMMAHW